MIVRILGEGQLEVADDQLDRSTSSTAPSRPRSRPATRRPSSASLAALLDGVRRSGTPLAEDSLDDSDLILPPADATIDEVRELLEGDGLIPG